MNAEFFKDIIEELADDYESIENDMEELSWNGGNACGCRHYCYNCLDVSVNDFM